MASELGVLLAAWWTIARASDAPAPDPPVRVVAPDGHLEPGRPALLYVAAASAPSVRPDLSLSAGTVTARGSVAPGIWTWEVVPPLVGVSAIEARVTVLGEPYTEVVPVRAPTPSTLRLPERIEGVARGGEVRFLVTGPDLPPPDAIEVVVGEGRVVEVSAVDAGLEVRVMPEEGPFPRTIPIGVRDRRHPEQPVWSWIRLRARPSLPMVSEPGSQVALEVGGRPYGPFTAGIDGVVTASVEQLPGERVAVATVTDDLGNEARTDIPLATSHDPALLVVPSQPIVPGQAPPIVWLHARAADGARWTGPPPACRTPAVDLPVGEIAPGVWMTVLPPTAEISDGVRAECRLGSWSSPPFRVPAAEGVPSRVRLRVWPTELRSDFPSAEIQVMVEDTRGERLPAEGVRVDARHGTVSLSTGGAAATGEYLGDAAVAFGDDILTARYDPPSVGTRVDQLRLGWAEVPHEGTVWLHGRALDAQSRPVPGVVLQLDAGAAEASLRTGPDGWASAQVDVPSGHGPLVLRVADGRREARIPVLRGQSATGGPGTAELTDTRRITIDPGRVHGISVSVEPAILRTGPGSVAWVRVALEDRAGRPITDEPVQVEVTEGVVQELKARPDGTYVAEYLPLASDRARDVVVTARTDTLRSSATLRLEPRVVRVSVGPWAGVLSNFGAVTAPVVGIDGDVRLRTKWLGESGMVRFSVATYTFTASADAGIAGLAALQTTVVPINGVLLFRQDLGPAGLWAGAGGTLAPYHMQVRLDDRRIATGGRVAVGPSIVAGASRRALAGELYATLRSTFLPVSGGEYGFYGNLGGLAAGLGYRVVL